MDIQHQILEKMKAYDTIMLFRHSRVDGDCVGATKGMKALIQASFPDLMEQPIDTNALYRNLYASDYAQLVVRAKFLLHVQFTEKNVAYVYTTMDGKAEYGVDDFTLSRGMVNSMADMRGVDIWVNFTESDKGVLCELRSSRFNINPIAVKYGGGGHMKASGATLKNREEAMAMLHDLDEMMGESK